MADPPDLRDWVVVFDLDDTLIAEREYQRSGVEAVAGVLTLLHGRPILADLLEALDLGEEDLWAQACTLLELPQATKESLLWIYRLHQPCIRLVPGMSAVLERLQRAGARLAVLSDGRSVSQRLKLLAVGLERLPAYISEEYGAGKPDPLGYELIERRWPGCRFVYVADNPGKDFIAPNRLGWFTIGARWVENPVHPRPEPCRVASGPASPWPHCWLSRPGELPDRLKSGQIPPI